MQDCFALLRHYYYFQLDIVLGALIILAAYEGITAYAEHRVPFKATWLSAMGNDFAGFLCLMFLGLVWLPLAHCLFQCKANDREATLVLLTNSLLIASHLISAVTLLLAGLGGALERVAFFGGTIFLMGVAISGGVWPPVQGLWLFWGIPVGLLGGGLELYGRRQGGPIQAILSSRCSPLVSPQGKHEQ